MTQPGETSGFSAMHHLGELQKYTPEIRFDHVILNDQVVSTEQRERYFAEGSEQIGIDEGAAIASEFGVNVVYANLLDDGEKVRHAPGRLAGSVLSCARATKPAAQNGSL
jgi:2-phospho-L-lactate transferase/gluconeogenesis factor (CofD/UPF0052 family)